MSPPNVSGSAVRFALATEGAADTWLRKAAAGEPVTAGERNAFVTQAGAAMDALADPTIVRAVLAGDADAASRSALAVPRARYFGPVATANGQEVPVIGTVQPPREWFGKRDPSVKAAAGLRGARLDPATRRVHAARDSGSLTWADVLSPNNEERRALYLATGNVLRSLQNSGEVVSNVRRDSAGVDAGLAPLAIAGIVVGVVALVSWAVYLYEQTQIVTIRENAETARQAAELQAAQAGWMQRVQWQLAHPGQPMPPPSPAETRVTGRPYPATPSPAEDGATQFLNQLRDGALKLGALTVGGLVVVTVVPPVLSNLADRATRPRAAVA